MLTFLLLQLLAVLALAQRAPDWTWREGRATHYGGPGDGWSIHKGSCQYYYLDPGVATGWDIVAPADANWDYDGPSGCGVCYEVSCSGATFKDGYGNQLDRNSVCYDQGASTIVMVTDVCPCYYPSNQYSNRRWCCGDMFHFDMSVYAFEKLADKKWGVIGIKYRRVSCDHKPDRQAYVPSGGDTTPAWESPPWGWSSSKDRRPQISYAPVQTSSASASSSTYASGGSSWSQSSASANGYASTSSSSSSSSSSGSTSWVLYDYLDAAWQDKSYNSHSWQSSKGPDGSPAYCTTVSAGGAVSLWSAPGKFNGMKQLRVQVMQVDGKVPGFDLLILSAQGSCREIQLPLVQWSKSVGSGWVELTVPLNAFSWSSPDWSQSVAQFNGCGGANINAWDIAGIMFKNTWGSDQWLCFDQLRIE